MNLDPIRNSRPAAGTWRVQLKGFLNTPTTYTGTAQVDTLVPVTQ